MPPGSANGSELDGFPSKASSWPRLMPGTTPGLYVDGGLDVQPAAARLSASRPALAVRAHLARFEIERIDAETRIGGPQFEVMVAEVFVHHEVIFPRLVDQHESSPAGVETDVRSGVCPSQRRAVLQHEQRNRALSVRRQNRDDLDRLIADRDMRGRWRPRGVDHGLARLEPRPRKIGTSVFVRW